MAGYGIGGAFATVKTPNLRAWREARGHSQRSLAREANLNHFTVLRAERGEDIRPTNAAKIAAALDITVADLMAEEDRPPAPLKVGAPQESGRQRKAEEPGHADDVGEKVVMIDLDEFRAKLRQEGLDEALTDFVVAVAENTMGGESLYRDVAPSEPGQPEAQQTVAGASPIKREVTDTAAATDEEAVRIRIGELKELLARQGLDEEAIEHVLSGRPFWGIADEQ